MHLLLNPLNTGRKILCAILLICFTNSFSRSGITEPVSFSIPSVNSLYKHLHLADLGLKEEVLQQALEGYSGLEEQHLLNGSHIISIADFSQPSTAKRLYIIDVAKGELLFQTWVAHGRNSGEEYASSFSNNPNSYQSSYGFYVTGATYNGKHGLSLRLVGKEKGINDNAEQRGIVIHGASYVCENFIKQTGRLGRSQGCPAVPEELSTPIINTIKEGSCLFIYSQVQNSI